MEIKQILREIVYNINEFKVDFIKIKLLFNSINNFKLKKQNYLLIKQQCIFIIAIMKIEKLTILI